MAQGKCRCYVASFLKLTAAKHLQPIATFWLCRLPVLRRSQRYRTQWQDAGSKAKTWLCDRLVHFFLGRDQLLSFCASSAARLIAAIMLSGRAVPLPAMSKAVP